MTVLFGSTIGRQSTESGVTLRVLIWVASAVGSLAAFGEGWPIVPDDFASIVSSRFWEFAKYTIGPQSKHLARQFERYILPPLATAAHSAGLQGAPRIVLPVWIQESATELRGPLVDLENPEDGALALWEGSEYTLLAIQRKAGTSVRGLANGTMRSECVETRYKKRTVTPGLTANDATLHVAIGLWNRISIGPSFTNRSRPNFEAIVQHLSGGS